MEKYVGTLFARRNTGQTKNKDFPDGPVVKNPPSNAGDVGWIPG